MPMDNVTLENTQQSISSRDAKSVASVMVNGKWVNLSDTLEQANVKSDVGTVAKQVAAQQEVVSNAVSVADSAQSAADAAVASAQVTSDAVSAIASATAEAKQGANDALSRAKSAWDVATNAKSAVTDFDPLLKSAQSDASNAIAQIADTASALSDAKAAFTSDVAVAKNLASTAQTTADNAVKSASSVANDLTAVASQAKSNADGITKVTSDVGLLQTTVADNSGNISTIQETAKQIQQAVSDNAGNITVAKQTASEAKVQASNAESDFAQLSIRAGQIEASVATNSGAIASVQQTANGLTTTVGKVDDRVKKIEDTTNWTTKTGALDMDTLTTTQNIYYRDTNLKNADGEAGWAYIQVVSTGERVTQTVWHDRSSIQHTRTGAIDGSTYDWDAWNKVATNAQVVDVKQSVDGISTIINDPKTGLNATYQTAAGNATTISNVKSDVYQLETTANGLTSRVGNLESKTNTQETAIEQNKNAITLKADQTDVDTVKGTVAGLQSSLTVQGNQIQTKVSASDVSGMLKGYATQDYTQSLVTQQANTLSSTITKVKNQVNSLESAIDWTTKTGALDMDTLTTTQNIYYRDTNLKNADGEAGWAYIQVVSMGERVTQTVWHDRSSIQHTRTGAVSGSSYNWDAWNRTATNAQISNLTQSLDGLRSTVATKADQSTVTQLSNLVQTKVSSDDYNSQITQLNNDIDLRVKSADLISQINLQAGTALIQSNKLVLDAGTTIFTGDAFIPSAAIANLDASKLTFYGADNTYATMGASIAQYDDDKVKSTISLQYNGGIEIHSSDQQGSILTMHDNTIRLASKTWGDNSNPYQYSGFYAAPNYSLMNTYHKDGTASGVAIDDNRIWIYGSSKDQQLGALQADVGWYSINGKTGLLTGNQIALKSESTQVTLTDRNINIENTIDTNSSNYDVGIHIKGWAEMTGWFTCMGLTQTSLLSAKTRIEPLDTAKALELINSADVTTYQYKQEVAQGGTKRHASVIIDDVNDVAQYQTPDEIISEDRQGRNDGDIVGYLMGSVQELTKRIKTLESKVG